MALSERAAPQTCDQLCSISLDVNPDAAHFMFFVVVNALEFIAPTTACHADEISPASIPGLVGRFAPLPDAAFIPADVTGQLMLAAYFSLSFALAGSIAFASIIRPAGATTMIGLASVTALAAGAAAMIVFVPVTPLATDTTTMVGFVPITALPPGARSWGMVRLATGRGKSHHAHNQQHGQELRLRMIHSLLQTGSNKRTD